MYRAREAELAIWPLPEAYADDDVLKAALFGRKGRARRDPVEPDWAYVSTELKRKGVTLILLWQEYRESHPDGYAYTWFCTSFRAFERRTSTRFRHRHRAGEVIQTDYAGLTKEIIDPATGEVRVAQIFVAVLGASSYTFATASLSQDLADWDREPLPRVLVFWRGNQERGVRQPEIGGGQAAVVRADPEPDL